MSDPPDNDLSSTAQRRHDMTKTLAGVKVPIPEKEDEGIDKAKLLKAWKANVETQGGMIAQMGQLETELKADNADVRTHNRNTRILSLGSALLVTAMCAAVIVMMMDALQRLEHVEITIDLVADSVFKTNEAVAKTAAVEEVTHVSAPAPVPGPEAKTVGSRRPYVVVASVPVVPAPKLPPEVAEAKQEAAQARVEAQAAAIRAQAHVARRPEAKKAVRQKAKKLRAKAAADGMDDPLDGLLGL